MDQLCSGNWRRKMRREAEPVSPGGVDRDLNGERALLGDAEGGDRCSVGVVDSGEALIDEESDAVLAVSVEHG